MCLAIDNSTSCEIGSAVHFLHSKNMNVAEINELCSTIYGQNVISEGTVRQWCRMFEDGQTDVHDEEQSGQPTICSEL
jgi:hypothetical protein